MSVVLPINEDSRYRKYTASAGQTVFAVPFPFQDNDDIVAIKDDDGDYVELSSALYTLSGAGDAGGGSLTFTTGRTVGEIIIVLGRAVLERLSSIVRDGRFSSKLIDDELDRNRIIQQELASGINRAVKARFGEDPQDLPPPSAGQFLAWDDAGEKLVNAMPGTRREVVYFESFAAAQAYTASDETFTIKVMFLNRLLTYARDDDATVNDYALRTADGQYWTPAGEIYADHFGAPKDGVANATAALQRAARFAARRGYLGVGTKVRLTPGSYAVSNLVLPDGVVLEGENKINTRLVKLDPTDTSWLVESEGFDADIAANSFSSSVSTSMETGLRNIGIYGGKTFAGTDTTIAVSGSSINVSGNFQVILNGGGTITTIAGGVEGQPIKLMRGDSNVTINVGGTDAINVTLTTSAPYLFLHYIGGEWRLTESVDKLAGGVRLYTRRPVLDNVMIYNILGGSFWIAGPSTGGQTNYKEMPEGVIGPLYAHRSSGSNFRISGFHDSVFKELCGATAFYHGLICERIDGVSACTGEVIHAHMYAAKGRGVDVRGPMHFTTLITESNSAEGIVVNYTDTVSTGPGWIDRLQVYSNCVDADDKPGVSMDQIALLEDNWTISSLVAAAATTDVEAVRTLHIAANNCIASNLSILGNARTIGISCAGKGNRISGTVKSAYTGLSIDGVNACQIDLAMDGCTRQVYNSGATFEENSIDITFDATAGAFVWVGTAPTAADRLANELSILGDINGTKYRSKFRGKATLSVGATGEVRQTLTHNLWYTPDASEVTFGLYFTGANFNWTASATPQAFVYPYTDTISATTIDLVAYVPTAVATSIVASVNIG